MQFPKHVSMTNTASQYIVCQKCLIFRQLTALYVAEFKLAIFFAVLLHFSALLILLSCMSFYFRL